MKIITSFVIILLMSLSLYSCKRPTDNENAISYKNEEIAQTDETNVDDKAQADDETQADTETVTKETVVTTETDDNVTKENRNDNFISEPLMTEDPNTDIVEEAPDSNYNEHVCRFYYTKATHNDVTYNKIINRDYFGEASIYHEIDFSTLELTKETVEIEYYCPLETEGYGCHLKKSATICKLPDNMANDKIIDFLVVRFEDGEYDMLFDIDPPTDSTLYELHEALQRLYGEAFDSSEFIEKIIIHHGIEGDAYEVNDRVNISKIYDIVTSATRTSADDTIKYEKDTSYYIVLYNDNMYKYYNVGDPSYGAHAHQLVYEHEYIDALPYDTDYHLDYENFEELLQSFMTEENLVKE